MTDGQNDIQMDGQRRMDETNGRTDGRNGRGMDETNGRTDGQNSKGMDRLSSRQTAIPDRQAGAH
jgi:hypothetical protein